MRDQTRALLRNWTYIWLILANTVLYYIVSGIQYWSTYYFVNVYNLSLAQANLWFGLIAISAPITGSLLSSLVTNISGGYHEHKLLQLIVIMGILAMFFAAMMPLAQRYEQALALLWIISFVGAICLPNITGAYLVRVDPN